MSSKIIELKPNRDLLDVNFSGYKLSLDPVSSYQYDLEGGVDHVLPSDDQYSYLHLKVFSLHNHLCGDPWSPNDVYFIDKNWKVKKNISDIKSGQLKGVKEVWEVPRPHSRQAGHYNPSLSFAAPETALIADGTGVLHILWTGTRSSWKPAIWEEVFRGAVWGAETPFVIADSRLLTAEGRSELHCLLLRVDEAEGQKEKRSHSRFQTTISWLVFTQSDSALWTVLRSSTLACRGELDYLALEEGCEAVYAACEHGVKFIFDSQKPAEVEGDNGKAEAEEERKHYKWQQGAEDIEISFSLSQNVQRKEVVVETEEKSISIVCGEIALLSGDLWSQIDPSLTGWTLENGKLQVTITKCESGRMWPDLVPSDCRGEEVGEVHRRLAHLCSEMTVTDGEQSSSFNSQQLEDCDAGSTNNMLLRLDPLTHSVTHQASLGGHQTLFCTRLAGSAVPALCLRHDVDGCVWQPAAPLTANTASSWPISHVGTFHAFGYVQASKSQKKFVLCPPDLSFVAICDTSRHVYIYRQPTAVNGELRNRKTGQRVSHSAQQQLFALSDVAEVLGAHASNHWLFVVSSNRLLALHINP